MWLSTTELDESEHGKQEFAIEDLDLEEKEFLQNRSEMEH